MMAQKLQENIDSLKAKIELIDMAQNTTETQELTEQIKESDEKVHIITEKYKNLSFYSNAGKVGAFVVYTIPVWQYFQLLISKRPQIEKIMEVEKLS